MVYVVDPTPSLSIIAILFVCFCIGIGGLIRCLLRNLTYSDLRLPYSSFILLAGIMIGFIALGSNKLTIFTTFLFEVNFFLVASLIFPPLIFKTVLQVDSHLFLKSFPQILAISTLGFIVCCLITGFFITYVSEVNLDITTALLFGVMASLTDSKETGKFLGRFKNVGVILAGEELIIIGIGMFTYDLIVHFDEGPLVFETAVVAMYKITVPILIGLIIGKIYVYIISREDCDFYSNITASCFVSYTLLYSVQIYLGASGVLTLIVFGMMICCHKRQLLIEIENSLSQFWLLIYSLAVYIIYIVAGILMVYTCQDHCEGKDVIRIVFLYIICLLVRGLMFLVMMPVLKRFGYGLNWKRSVLLVWGTLKGTSTLVFALSIFKDSNIVGEYSFKILIYAVGLVLMQLIINGTTLKKIVLLLGLSTISVIKMSNMNEVMRHVMAARDRSINMLKMNRLFADAVWDVVRNATKIVHPYKDFQLHEGNFTEGEDKGFHNVRCPECHKDIPHHPSPKELREMKREAYLRILKAKKVSYWRQYDCGLMSKEANRTLVGIVDNALEKNQDRMDVDCLKNLWKPGGCLVRLRNKLVQFMPKSKKNSVFKTPLKRWQLCLYKMTTTLWWEYSIILLIIINIISIILDHIYRPTNVFKEQLALITIASVFFVALTLQILLNLLGIGCYNYMRSVWHFVDMVTFAVTSFYIFYIFKFAFSRVDKKKIHSILIVLSSIRAIYIIRSIRLYYVIRSTIPKIVELLDRKIDVQLAHGYDVGKGFVTGEQEVIKLLPRFISNKTILTEIKTQMEADRLAITKEIGILQRNRPSIAITVKTRESMAHVLHAMRASTKELKDGGLMEDEEYIAMTKILDGRQKYIRKKFLHISPCPPDVLLRQISWLHDNEETAIFLITHSFMVNLNFEEILIKADELPQGIYIIISGLVRMAYFPNIKKLESLEKCGALPNVDYPITVDYSENQEDYIVSGNVLGEIGILTQRTYDSTIICESSVQAYFISIDVMNYAMKSQGVGYSGLEQQIWKAVSVRLAGIILSAVPAYQSWTQEMIQIHLERAFVPKLTDTKLIILSDAMESVLLIQGRALDVINKDIYLAPSYIPRTVRKISFVSTYDCHIEPILLIVPAKDLDEQELIDQIEGEIDFMSTVSHMNAFQNQSEKKEKKARISNVDLEGLCEYKGGVRMVKMHPSSDATLAFRGKPYDQLVEDEKIVETDLEMDRRREYQDTTFDTARDSISISRRSTADRIEIEEDAVEGPSKSFLEPSKFYTLSYLNYKPLLLSLESIQQNDEIESIKTEEPNVVRERKKKKKKVKKRNNTVNNEVIENKDDNEIRDAESNESRPEK